MNWYRVKTQHDDFRKGDLILLEGGAREAALEKMGYLEFVSVDKGSAPGPSRPEPEFLALEPATKEEAVKPKRGRRGQSGENQSQGVEPVREVPGD